MVEIKSALELALAKTEGLSVDKAKFREKEIRVEGRKSSLSFLDGRTSAEELSGKLKGYGGDERAFFLEGICETVFPLIKLPSDTDTEPPLEKAEELLAGISGDPAAVSEMFAQLRQFFGQYLQQINTVKEQLTAQYMPTLRRKEEMLAAQTGTRIKLEPMDDPDFRKAWDKHVKSMEASYREALDNAKVQLKAFIVI